ncbi:MAG TPA: apolipoprotein N-acyltransferase [Streptosporangiaceae bacterium]|nr:apolipoprotein N-acyltransferase [Streptosporangiaceae bacterium]
MRLVSPGPAVGAAARPARSLTAQPMATPLAMLTALAGGLALAAAFPPAGIWPLAAVGPALLVVALWQQRARTALAAGVIFGLAFFFPLLSWLINVAWYVWVALAIAETVIFAAATVGQWLLLRLRAWPLAVAGWWVAAEALRDRWPWEGFPWGRLVMSQASAPTARWVAIGGPPFLTFLIALTAACLAWLLLGPVRVAGAARPAGPAGGHSAVRARIWPALALAAMVALCAAGALLPGDVGTAGAPTAVVAAIQGDVPHARNLPNLLRAATVTQDHATATSRLAALVASGRARPPDLVVWPENSTDQDPRFNPYIFDVISGAVATIDRPVLVGAVLQDPVRNAGQLWLPGKGPVATYVKRRLVPFGEVIPFRGLLDKVTSLPSLQPVDFTPGHRAVVFHVGKIRVGDVICYEVGFDGLVSSEVAAGANLLTVQTNDADFELDGQTGETLQQLDMARIRAIEHDRAVVVASTTGISAIIAPDGSLLASSRMWQQAEIEARVPLRTATTLADRIGGWPEGVITFATLAALALAITGLIRERRRLSAVRQQAAQ